MTELARQYGREVEPLYTEAQMLARVAAERERCANEIERLRDILAQREDDILTHSAAVYEATRLADKKVAAERERCAKLCDDLDAEHGRSDLPGFVLEIAAQRIRAGTPIGGSKE